MKTYFCDQIHKIMAFKRFLVNSNLTFTTIVLIISSMSVALAQPAGRAIVDQPIEWFAFASTMKVASKINIYADVHLRYAQDVDPMQYQIRFAPEYVFNGKMSAAPAAYAYVRNFFYGEQPAAYINNEHRIYQQFVYKYSVKKFGFNHRFRVEERFIQSHSKTATGEVVDNGFDNFQVRFRYRGVITYPLNKPKIEAGALFVSAYDEFFMSWGKRVTFHEPDQNRLYAGLGYQFTKDISLQTGFFYQMLIKANGAQQENNVGVMTQFTYNFDFTKKQD